MSRGERVVFGLGLWPWRDVGARQLARKDFKVIKAVLARDRIVGSRLPSLRLGGLRL